MGVQVGVLLHLWDRKVGFQETIRSSNSTRSSVFPFSRWIILLLILMHCNSKTCYCCFLFWNRQPKIFLYCSKAWRFRVEPRRTREYTYIVYVCCIKTFAQVIFCYYKIHIANNITTLPFFTLRSVTTSSS